jgi:hypothetical protein
MSTQPHAGMKMVPADWYELVKEALEYHATEECCDMCLELREQARQFEQTAWQGEQHDSSPDDQHDAVDS